MSTNRMLEAFKIWLLLFLPKNQPGEKLYSYSLRQSYGKLSTDPASPYAHYSVSGRGSLSHEGACMVRGLVLGYSEAVK